MDAFIVELFFLKSIFFMLPKFLFHLENRKLYVSRNKKATV